MILIKDVSILPMTAPEDFIAKGYIIIDGARIVEISEGQAPDGNRFRQVINAGGMVAMPGLINTHTHAAMTLLRGYADDLPLMEWLQQKIWPMEEKLTAEDCYWGTMLAAAEMIKSGTTCFADMYFHMDQVAAAVEKSGLRACLCQGMIDGPNGEAAFTRSQQLFSDWHGQAQGRINVMLGPHAPHTCSPQYLKRVINLSEQLGIGIHIHIAETQGEYEDIFKQYGKSPVSHLQEVGLFARPVLAAHCVFLNDDDIGILAQHSVGVAHNPESNMKLASGIARVPEMLEAGITVGLGTDGASSNNNLDMIQELRSCSFLHKVNRKDPQLIPAYQALEMATVNGAHALRWEGIGTLKPGMLADIILVDFEKPHLYPRYQTEGLLAYSALASDVDTVLVNGKVLMQGRQLTTIDEKEVFRQVEQIVNRLISSI
ncbi:MAG: amidohydrolase [Syntrophomonadaceae bacterium]|nr:amidohydrolase [Syntrophomonadaceae bacterium]